MRKVYADCNATTPLLNDVKHYLLQGRLNGPFANPNSLHSEGSSLLQGIEQCRRHLATYLQLEGQEDRIIFTSGSSESITTAFWMSIGQNILRKNSKNHILCSVIEHAAVQEAALYWEKMGAIIHWVPCDKDGIIEIEHVKALLEQHHKNLALVAIMAANNETGVIQPFEQVATLCQHFHVEYLCDTTQIIGKISLPQEITRETFFCGSGHKLGAPFGSGFLVLPRKDNFQRLIYGGPQEKQMRAGTQNYMGIETMTVALDYHYKNITQWKILEKTKKNFERELKLSLGDRVEIISRNSARLPNTSLISFKGLHSQGLQIELESRNIFVTTSAACSDNEPQTATVLKKMGFEDDVGRSVIRVSTGLENVADDYDRILTALKMSFQVLHKISY